MPDLYYSERKLWDECPPARPVLERLAGIRDYLSRLASMSEALHDAAEFAMQRVEFVGANKQDEWESHKVTIASYRDFMSIDVVLADLEDTKDWPWPEPHGEK